LKNVKDQNGQITLDSLI